MEERLGFSVYARVDRDALARSLAELVPTEERDEEDDEDSACVDGVGRWSVGRRRDCVLGCCIVRNTLDTASRWLGTRRRGGLTNGTKCNG